MVAALFVFYLTLIVSDILQNSLRPEFKTQRVVYDPAFLGAAISTMTPTVCPLLTLALRS